MSEKKMKNIVRGMVSAVMIMCTAIAAAVFPSYAVDADSISSEGNIVIEDGEVALYADDIDYLTNELNSLVDEISDEDKISSVPIDYLRKNKVKSKGIIDYAGGTVVMNAADLIYIANEMDVFENTYKYMILKYLNDIHTYMTADGSVTHNAEDSDDSYFPTFGQLVKGISLSQEVNTGTTADNLSEGMGAWINGEYITGNGNDVNMAYLKGLTEGFDNAMENCSISYIYHEHTGSSSSGDGCYGNPVYHSHSKSFCPYYETEIETQCPCEYTSWTTGDEGYGDYKCGNCGHEPHGGNRCSYPRNFTITTYTCGKEGMIDYYTINCGKTEGVTIESATLIFK
ncbi:MAG: hypothetical protein HDR30_03270 [Lachnospiraceae bacterium]|nr:hypothetical protein [Lachnospiraceae bacterium]